MDLVTTTLPEMRVVSFDGFRPEPEQTAHALMAAWLERHPEIKAASRSYGYNIDRSGERSHEPDNEGYRLLVAVPDGFTPADPEVAVAIERPGTFAVGGIEGSFSDDPSGSWITDGWHGLRATVERQGLRVHPSHRWFEEALEAADPGRVRFNLYLELKESDGVQGAEV